MLFLICLVALVAVVFVRLVNQRQALSNLKCTAKPAEAEARPDARISLLTHNLWLHYFVAAPYRSARVALFLRILKQGPLPTVVVVQEVFLLRLGPLVLHSYVSQLIDGMKALGYVWSDPRVTLPSFFGQNSGVIVFSRLPFVTPPRQEVFHSSDEFLNNKGLARAHIQLSRPGSSLIVVGTHLDSGKASTRAKQLTQIASATKLASNDISLSTIVTGDLNEPASIHNSAYQNQCRILEPLKNAAEDNSAARFYSFRKKPSNAKMFVEQFIAPLYRTRWPKGLEYMSLDHVFYGGGLAVQSTQMIDWSNSDDSNREPFVPVSDHLGVLVTLRFA